MHVTGRIVGARRGHISVGIAKHGEAHFELEVDDSQCLEEIAPTLEGAMGTFTMGERDSFPFDSTLVLSDGRVGLDSQEALGVTRFPSYADTTESFLLGSSIHAGMQIGATNVDLLVGVLTQSDVVITYRREGFSYSHTPCSMCTSCNGRTGRVNLTRCLHNPSGQTGSWV